MDRLLLKACYVFGIPPRIWMVHNPYKIYEFIRVTRDSGLQKHHSILDLGCGNGIWTLSLARKCRKTIGVDTSVERIKTAQRFLVNSPLRNRVEFLCARLEDTDLPAACLDRVYSLCTLEHIVNMDRVLEEILRVLKPGGELHLSVDSLANLRQESVIAKHQRDHSVVRYFTNGSFHKALCSAGFEVLDIFPILTSEFAKEQFRERILHGYSHGVIRRLLLYKRFWDEDRSSQSKEGIMLIGRCRRSRNGHDLTVSLANRDSTQS